MFDDPKIVKLIIIALVGIIVVLTIAVIYLAVKKNTYYVDENGEEITTFSTKKTPEENIVPPVQEVRREPDVQPAASPLPVFEEKEDDEDEGTLEVPMSSRPADITAVKVSVTVEDETTETELTSFPCMIGRETSCGLVVSEPAVSRRHANMTSEHGGLFIEPLSEHNGTFVNGDRLPSGGRTRVYEGDSITLGRAEIVIEKITH